MISSPSASPDRSFASTALHVTHRLVSGLLGLIFLGAGLLKVVTFASFAETTGLFLSIPPALGVVAAILVLVTEIGLGVALLANRHARAASVAVGVMLILFVAVVVRAHVAGISAPCNCFGALGLNLSLPQHLITNVALFAFAVVSAVTARD